MNAIEDGESRVTAIRSTAKPSGTSGPGDCPSAGAPTHSMGPASRIETARSRSRVCFTLGEYPAPAPAGPRHSTDQHDAPRKRVRACLQPCEVDAGPDRLAVIVASVPDQRSLA